MRSPAYIFPFNFTWDLINVLVSLFSFSFHPFPLFAFVFVSPWISLSFPSPFSSPLPFSPPLSLSPPI